MACKIQYIKDKYTGREQEIVASLHQQIERELDNPDIHKYKGAYYEFTTNGPANITRVNKGRQVIGSINDKYGKVLSILPTREIRINVLPVAQKFIDRELGQTQLFQLPTGTVAKKNQQLDSLLKEYAQINGIKLEYFDELADKYHGDIIGMFDSIQKLIAINKGKESIDTLPEEVAHSLVEALGDEDTLVKRALNLIGRTDYKTTLDPKYLDIYKNNDKSLRKEYLGKLIADTLVKKFEPKDENDIKLLDTIFRLIKKFVSLFKSNDRIDELEKIVDTLADKITSKEKMVVVGNTIPENTVWFQIDSKKAKAIDESIKKQYVYFKKRLETIRSKMAGLDQEDPKYLELERQYKSIDKGLSELVETNNKQIIIDLGTELLDNVENKFLAGLESGKIPQDKIKPEDIIYAIDTLDSFKGFPGLSDRSIILYNRLEPFIDTFVLSEVNTYATEPEGLKKADIESQTVDINKAIKNFGALADLGNYLARTIGSIIKAAQNRISTQNKELVERVKTEVDALRDYSKSVGINEKNMYEPFIQNFKGTTILTTKYTSEWYDELASHQGDRDWYKKNATKIDGKWVPKHGGYVNENFNTIINTPELKRFYDFHKNITRKAAENLPSKIDTNFIANIKKTTLSDVMKSDKKLMAKFKDAISHITDVSSKEFDNEGFVGNEELYSDIIPLKYIAKVGAEEKSRDLGENLFRFAAFANSYKEMSEVLPKTRLLQEQIKKKHYTKSNDPKTKIKGEESNIFKMADDYIKMQVKGQMKEDEFKFKVETLYDEDGNPSGEKYVHGSDIIDFGLKYNSLLRIGLNPFNAITNVLIGDIGNIVEGVGGRFYTLGNLKKATDIFFSQNFKDDSVLNHWLEKLNPLQELEDYEHIEKVELTKSITGDKVKNLMYSPQRIGEKFLQTRTMLAILIKDGYMSEDGTNTSKADNLTPIEIAKLTDKIQRVNQMIHGRYSSRDAATINQSVIWRMVGQFKKWIPAAIESRVASKHYDNRLGVEIEGRYQTAWKLLVVDLKDTLKRLQAGELTELEKYNMRKNLTEITILLATVLMYVGLGGFGDDDKKLKQNPYYKFCMNQLDRVSGDMAFWYNPAELNRNFKQPVALLKTTGDLMGVVAALPYAFGIEGSIYTKGPKKGENKLLAKLVDITPVVHPIADVARLTKKVAYQEIQKQ